MLKRSISREKKEGVEEVVEIFKIVQPGNLESGEHASTHALIHNTGRTGGKINCCYGNVDGSMMKT